MKALRGWDPQTEGADGSIPGTEIEEGITERNKELIDMAEEPKLTVAECSRWKRCEGPFSKEEWGEMTNSRKRKTLGNLGLLHQGEKKTVEAPAEAITADNVGQVMPPPQSSKPPPPKPPSTYANDKPRLESISETAEKGTSKGKGKEQGKAKGKSGTAVGTEGGKCSTGTQGETANIEYTSYTARERNWGTLKQKEEWGKRFRQDASRWEWSSREHKYVYIGRKPERKRICPNTMWNPDAAWGRPKTGGKEWG